LGYILLVDDDARIARTYARVFRGKKFVWKATAEEALEHLETAPEVAVILCDLNLQPTGMQGQELVGELRSRRPELMDRTVVMSGHHEAEVRAQFGYPIACAQKPLGIAQLRALVEPFQPDADT